MNETALFKIVFEGKIKEGTDLQQVKERLAALFKIDIARVEKIFANVPTVIQHNLSAEKARKYQQLVAGTGALCRIEQEQKEPIIPPAVPFQEVSHPPIPPIAPVYQSVPAQTLYTGVPADSPATLYTPPDTVPGENSDSDHELPIRVQHIDRAGWKSLAIGLGITAVVLYFPFIAYVFRYIVTLVHELGHAALGWFYGYPSIPAFDFTYGGGATIHDSRLYILLIIIYAGIAWLFYLFRKNILTVVVLAVFTVFYSYTAFTWVHSVIMLFMGHGTELIFGGIFLYRAISGSSIIHDAERPLYAFLGLFTFIVDITFAYRLMHSAAYRLEYEEAKGGGHWMDFSRIAEDYLGLNLTAVASFFLFLCLLAPVLTFCFYRYKKYIFRFLKRLVVVEVE